MIWESDKKVSGKQIRTPPILVRSKLLIKKKLYKMIQFFLHHQITAKINNNTLVLAMKLLQNENQNILYQ